MLHGIPRQHPAQCLHSGCMVRIRWKSISWDVKSYTIQWLCEERECQIPNINVGTKVNFHL